MQVDYYKNDGVTVYSGPYINDAEKKDLAEHTELCASRRYIADMLAKKSRFEFEGKVSLACALKCIDEKLLKYPDYNDITIKELGFLPKL